MTGMIQVDEIVYNNVFVPKQLISLFHIHFGAIINHYKQQYLYRHFHLLTISVNKHLFPHLQIGNYFAV